MFGGGGSFAETTLPRLIPRTMIPHPIRDRLTEPRVAELLCATVSVEGDYSRNSAWPLSRVPDALLPSSSLSI